MSDSENSNGFSGGQLLTFVSVTLIVAGITAPFVLVTAASLFLGPALQYRDQQALKTSGFILTNGQFAFHMLNTGICQHFSEGLLLDKSGRCLDRAGNQVFKAEIREYEPFSEGLAAVEFCSKEDARRWGFIDRTGKKIIAGKFDNAHSFKNGLAPARFKGKWGFINKNGDWAISPTYENARPFSDGMATIQLDGKIGYIDTSGKLEIKPAYDVGMAFSEDVAQVANFGTESKPGAIFYIDKNGKILFEVDNSIRQSHNPKGYYSASHSSDFYDPDSLIASNQNTEYRADNLFGHPNERTQMFHNNRQQFTKDNRFGYLDKQGKTVIPFKFDTALPFSEGVACVSENKLYGFIDENGKYIIDKRFAKASNFHDGLAFVTSEEGTLGYIEKTGRMVITVDEVSSFSSDGNDFYDGLATVGPMLMYP